MTAIRLTDAEASVLNALSVLSKKYANGKGGLDAETLMRAGGGAFGSRVLVDTLASLYHRGLILYAMTDEVAPKRLWYLKRRLR